MGADRPLVAVVSPAHGRYAVTRLALAQRRWLCDVLRARGIDAFGVVVADDENLELAWEYGFETVEMANTKGLGAKFNAGYQYAGEQGADWFVHIGSDDWLHPDVFERLPRLKRRTLLGGRRLAFVDLLTGSMVRTRHDGPNGVIPWIIPRSLMEPSGFAPIRPEKYRGMDGYLIRGIRRSLGARSLNWEFHDPHDLARIDFKSDVNINLFTAVSGLFHARPEPDPWAALAEHYPRKLVQLARATHTELQEDPVPKLISPDGRLVSVSKAGIEPLKKRGYTEVGEKLARPLQAEPLPESPAKSAKRSEWDAYARAQGIDPSDYGSKDDLIGALGA